MLRYDGCVSRVGGWLGMWLVRYVVGQVSIWVKNGLTMHLQNISELRSENIDYVLVKISACMQDPKLLVMGGWAVGGRWVWVGLIMH